jgi:hypothetical protein
MLMGGKEVAGVEALQPGMKEILAHLGIVPCARQLARRDDSRRQQKSRQ